MLCARKQSRREKKTYLDDTFFFVPAGAWGVPVIGILLGRIRK